MVMATCQSTIDYFSRLPPELVLGVIELLTVDDVCRCLLVCSRWHQLLSAMEPYWRKACVRIGLPEHQIAELLPRYGTAKALLFATRRHKMSIGATPPKRGRLSDGYPVDIRYSCQFAEGRRLVGTVYKDFRPCEIIVDRVDHRMVTTTNVFSPSFQRIAENRVVWGHSDSTFYLCATASGIWTGYDLRTNLCQFSWQGETLYDSDLTIGCCKSCFLVATAKLFSFRSSEESSYWALGILRLGRNSAQQSSQIMRFKLPVGYTNISPHQANCGVKRVCLIPLRTSHTPEEDSHGFCNSHTLLIQWANSVDGYTLKTRGESYTVSRHPFVRFTASCKRLEEVIVRNLGLNTKFRLSSDGVLIGLIFNAVLHVWNVQSGRKISAVDVVLEKYSYEQMRLISLGHIYSIIGLEFNDALLVISTVTGDITWKISGFAQKHGRMVPPYIEFLCAVSEDWLSDISCPCSAAWPCVVYWNKTNRAVEGLWFGSLSVGGEEVEERPQRQKRKQGWWGSWRRRR